MRAWGIKASIGFISLLLCVYACWCVLHSWFSFLIRLSVLYPLNKRWPFVCSMFACLGCHFVLVSEIH